ncbi:hypothetical protein GGTG_01110, partial [Gaeumannomyces tritici R3-111a-1]
KKQINKLRKFRNKEMLNFFKSAFKINQYFTNPNFAFFGFNKIAKTKGINECGAVNDPTAPNNTALSKSRSATSTGTFRNRTVAITSLFITKNLILTQYFTCITVLPLCYKLPGTVTIGF